MKYISQLNAFWRWARMNDASSGEVLLYLTLLDVANASGWQENLSVPNSAFAWNKEKKSFERARKHLVSAGLVEYKKGSRGKAPVYSLKRLYLETQKEQIQNQYVPNPSPKCTTYIDKEKEKEIRKDIDIDIDIEKTETREEETNSTFKSEKPCPTEEIVRLFNFICADLPGVENITYQRAGKIRACWNMYPALSTFEEAFDKVLQSDFLMGKNNRGWQATFDWIMDPENMTKVLEGNYMSKIPPKEPSSLDGFSLEDFFEKP